MIDVPTSDPATLLRFIMYIYCGEYDDEKLPKLQYDTNLGDPQTDASSSSIDSKATHGTSPLSVAEPCSTAEPQGRNLEQPPTQSDTDRGPNETLEVLSTDRNTEECTCARSSACKIERLHANIRVYVLADYYQVPGLVSQAEEKIATILKHMDPSDLCARGFEQVCLAVYQSCPHTARSFRQHLLSTITSLSPHLAKNEAFMATVFQVPELSQAMWISLVKRHKQQTIQVEARERDLTAAEESRHEAWRKVAFHDSVLLDQINEQTVSCRHCYQRANITVERESRWTEMGQRKYILRCSCGTKYPRQEDGE